MSEEQKESVKNFKEEAEKKRREEREKICQQVNCGKELPGLPENVRGNHACPWCGRYFDGDEWRIRTQHIGEGPIPGLFGEERYEITCPICGWTAMFKPKNMLAWGEKRRVIQVKRGGEWKDCDVSDLRIDDVFRMFNDAERKFPVVYEGTEITEFIVVDDPHFVDGEKTVRIKVER